MKPIRPPAVAQRLVDAYITGLRQRLPVMFIKQIDKLPKASETQLQTLRKAFPSVPVELTHLLQRFNGSSWDVVATSGVTVVKTNVGTPGNTTNAASTDKVKISETSKMTAPSQIDNTLSSSPSSTTTTTTTDNDNKVNASQTHDETREKTIEYSNASEKLFTNKEHHEPQSIKSQQVVENTLTTNDLSKSNTQALKGSSNTEPREGKSKKMSKSPPAVAVAAAATAASFIKSTLVGKRSSSATVPSSSTTTSTMTRKHTRKERNAIPVLGSAYAACPYYLHSIEYMLQRHLPFAEQEQQEQQSSNSKEENNIISENNARTRESHSGTIAGNADVSEVIRKTDLTDTPTSKLTLSKLYNGFTLLNEPPRAPWENTTMPAALNTQQQQQKELEESEEFTTNNINNKNSNNNNSNTSDVSNANMSSNVTNSSLEQNAGNNKEEFGVTESKRVALHEPVSSVNVEKGETDRKIQETSKGKDSHKVHEQCVFIDCKIDKDSDVTLWLNFAESLYPHHLPKFLNKEEQQEYMQQEDTSIQEEIVNEKNVRERQEQQQEQQEQQEQPIKQKVDVEESTKSATDTTNESNTIDTLIDKAQTTKESVKNNITISSLPLYRTTESHLFIDFNPNESNNGARGQIIQYVRHPESFIVIAEDFGSYLKYLMSEEYDFIEELEDDDDDDDDGDGNNDDNNDNVVNDKVNPDKSGSTASNKNIQSDKIEVSRENDSESVTPTPSKSTLSSTPSSFTSTSTTVKSSETTLSL